MFYPVDGGRSRPARCFIQLNFCPVSSLRSASESSSIPLDSLDGAGRGQGRHRLDMEEVPIDRRDPHALLNPGQQWPSRRGSVSVEIGKPGRRLLYNIIDGSTFSAQSVSLPRDSQ